MTYHLGARSRAELEGVDLGLQRVVQRAIELTAQDFAVHDGHRTVEEQREHVRRGASKTMRSKHMTGDAVDLVPWIAGQLRWEWPPIYHIAAAMRRAAAELGVRLRWGGVWDRCLNELPAEADALEREVREYCARHPGPDFIDGPHFEVLR